MRIWHRKMQNSSCVFLFYFAQHGWKWTRNEGYGESRLSKSRSILAVENWSIWWLTSGPFVFYYKIVNKVIEPCLNQLKDPSLLHHNHPDAVKIHPSVSTSLPEKRGLWIRFHKSKNFELASRKAKTLNLLPKKWINYLRFQQSEDFEFASEKRINQICF